MKCQNYLHRNINDGEGSVLPTSHSPGTTAEKTIIVASVPADN